MTKDTINKEKRGVTLGGKVATHIINKGLVYRAQRVYTTNQQEKDKQPKQEVGK